MDDAQTAPRAVRLEFRDFGFAYPERPSPALAGVSFSLRAGELAVVAGRNGAGKSTLAMAVNGTIPRLVRGEARGEVRINGRPVGAPREMARRIGVVFQDFESHLVSSTAALEVAFPLENLGVDSGEQRGMVRETLSLVGLAGFDHRVPAELSGGEKQRLAIASAIALGPAIVVLDEPLTDLDPLGKSQVLEVLGRLREKGIAVVLVEHDPQAVLAADVLLVLDGGRLVYAGPPRALLADPGRCAEMGLPVWPPAEVKLALGLPGEGIGIDDVAEQYKVQSTKYEGRSTEREAGTAEARKPGSGGDAPDRPATRGSEPGTGRTPVLEFKAVTSGYPGGPDVLRDVSLAVRAGECLALLGQNGSGKTSLAKHVVGLIRVRRGRLLVKGRPVRDYSLSELSRVVGYVFQNPDHQIFADTVLDEVAFGVRNLGIGGPECERRVAEAVEAVGLAGREGEDPFALTKGERQRLAVASLLAYRPEVIFFDEPTTGLDAGEAVRMMEFIRRLNRSGTTVILITHAMWAAAEYAGRVVVLAEGRLVHDGPCAEVFGREEELRGLHLAPPPAAALANRLGIRALTTAGLLEALR